MESWSTQQKVGGRNQAVERFWILFSKPQRTVKEDYVGIACRGIAERDQMYLCGGGRAGQFGPLYCSADSGRQEGGVS